MTQSTTGAQAVSQAAAQLSAQAAEQEKIRGVFSTQETAKVGTGTTTRRVVQKMYWFVEQGAGDELICQHINARFVPSGTKKTITKEELLTRYEPEPEFYFSSVLPSMRQLDQHVDTGDRLRERNEQFAAEYSYSAALHLDEENIRANFGIGLTYLQRGDIDKAHNIFDRLVGMDGAFSTEHKHLFNEFGILLRKRRMLPQAASYYGRAIELSPDDENLRLNLARVLCEQQDNAGCLQQILQSIKISPQNSTAHKFLGWMQQNQLIPADMVPTVIDVLREIANLSPVPPAPVPPVSASVPETPAAASTGA